MDEAQRLFTAQVAAVISALTDINCLVKGIKLGAEDYLPKPFNEVLLHPRLETGLAKKRLRDHEVD